MFGSVFQDASSPWVSVIDGVPVPPHSYVEARAPSVIWRWGLSKVKRFRGGHEDGAPMMRLGSFGEEGETRACSLS